MSFSSEIKQELNKNSNLTNKKFSTESDYNINRFSKLLANLNINHNIEINREELCNKIKDIRNRTNYEIQ